MAEAERWKDFVTLERFRYSSFTTNCPDDNESTEAVNIRHELDLMILFKTVCLLDTKSVRPRELCRQTQMALYLPKMTLQVI